MSKRFLAASISFIIFAFFGFSATAFGFTTSNTNITRTFDKTVVDQNGVVTGTVILSNNENYAMNGFFLTLQVPNGVVVNTQRVNIIENNTVNEVSDYLFEIGNLNDIYAGYVPYRWVIETPTAFDENNPIPAGASVEIIFTATSTSGGTFDLDEFSWVGYFSDAPEGDQAAFGYSEASDAQSITFATSIPLPASGTFGRSVPGASTNIDTVDLSFGGTSGNVTITYQAYDVDTETEIEILINGQRVGYVLPTTNNSWGGVQSITLPDKFVNNNSVNIISFNNTYNPPNRYVWGIRNVATGGSVTGGIPLPAKGPYGRNVPGNTTTTSLDKVDFSFAEALGDVTITYEAYDVDTETEIEILINGNHIGYASLTANNNWGNMAILILPDEYVNDTSSNVLTFNNTYNPPNKYVWGVRNVNHGIPLPAKGLYGRNVPGATTTTSLDKVDFSFAEALGDVTITYEVYDVDTETEIEILINGNHIGYASLTANNSWGNRAVLVVPDEYVHDTANNVLTFNNTYNPPNRYVWGVRNVNHGIPLPTSGAYGNGVSGAPKIVNEIDTSFNGVLGDVTLTYEAYDVDTATEIEILINDEHVGYVPVTSNNAWGGMQVIVLPDEYVNDDSVNIVTFNNTYNPPNRYVWGVRNIAHGIPLATSDAYGKGAGMITIVNEIDFYFEGTAGNVTISYEAYDVDTNTEIEILINDEPVGYVPTTVNDSWGGVNTVVLPDRLVNNNSVNIITFNNTYNPPNAYYWGVRNVRNVSK